MVSLNPKMLPRLDEQEENLLARRRRAVAEDGELDRLDLTLTFLRDNRLPTETSTDQWILDARDAVKYENAHVDVASGNSVIDDLPVQARRRPRSSS
ncbi:hypothetical protein [Streptomyces sp. NPDC059918]|uniref:hypothetical protein n=1 Tax=unclassified Streptomyces TaxID=2593676 RepID=UPI00365FFF49